jgi:hypothetical protein
MGIYNNVYFRYLQTSTKRDILYIIFIEVCVPIEPVRLIQMCLNQTYSRVRLGKRLSDLCPIKNGLRQGDALSPLISTLL